MPQLPVLPTAYSPQPAAAEPPPDATLRVMDTNVTDGELMRRYARGDIHAFEQLYARHKAPLYRYLKRMCRDTDAANDLFQEVWGKLVASRERYEVRAQFNTYLYRIAHNACIDFYRRTGTQAVVDHDDEAVLAAPNPDQARPDVLAADAQVQVAFRTALEELPAEQRDTFLLYEESGLSVEDIGRITNVSMDTAKSRLRYAIAKLRAALRGYRLPEVVS
jgi:RNA polymerase sigma-70 factor, ECF subfamily